MYRTVGKRVFDLTMVLAFAPITIPVALIVGALVRLLLGSGVLFRQQRPGRGGRPFIILKFRTMRENRDRDGKLLSDAERLTRFGRLLRSTSLDELPELWNVFRGEMSLVGPRPLLMEYLERYSPEQGRRHEVLPGITGWAQVSGRNLVDWEDRFRLDVWYVDNVSIWLDLKALALTARQVFSRRGISAEGYATMPEFTGVNRNNRCEEEG